MWFGVLEDNYIPNWWVKNKPLCSKFVTGKSFEGFQQLLAHGWTWVGCSQWLQMHDRFKVNKVSLWFLANNSFSSQTADCTWSGNEMRFAFYKYHQNCSSEQALRKLFTQNRLPNWDITKYKFWICFTTLWGIKHLTN